MKKYLLILSLLALTASARGTNYFFGGDTTATSAPQRDDSSYFVDTITSPAYSGNLDSGIVWLRDNYKGPHSIAIVVYNSDSTILDSTAHFAVTGTDRIRYSAAFINGAAISASTQYFVGLHAASEGGADGSYQYYYNKALSIVSVWYKDDQPTIPATITGPTKTNSYPKAIGIYYSAAGGAVTRKPGKAHLRNSKW